MADAGEVGTVCDRGDDVLAGHEPVSRCTSRRSPTAGIRWEGFGVAPIALKIPGDDILAALTVAPWLTPDGNPRCFYCETRPDRPGPSGDPDRVSISLRESHQVLWSKSLPDGSPLDLSTSSWSAYLQVVSLEGRWTVEATTSRQHTPMRCRPFRGRLTVSRTGTSASSARSGGTSCSRTGSLSSCQPA